MSNEQKERLKQISHEILLPVYRAAMIGLLGMVTFFVTRVYWVVVEDHDRNIRQDSRLDYLEKLPDRVNSLEKNMVELRIESNDKKN